MAGGHDVIHNRITADVVMPELGHGSFSVRKEGLDEQGPFPGNAIFLGFGIVVILPFNNALAVADEPNLMMMKAVDGHTGGHSLLRMF